MPFKYSYSKKYLQKLKKLRYNYSDNIFAIKSIASAYRKAVEGKL